MVRYRIGRGDTFIVVIVVANPNPIVRRVESKVESHRGFILEISVKLTNKGSFNKFGQVLSASKAEDSRGVVDIVSRLNYFTEVEM